MTRISTLTAHLTTLPLVQRTQVTALTRQLLATTTRLGRPVYQVGYATAYSSDTA